VWVVGGLVFRKLYPEIPLRVEYELTELGESLLPLVTEMTAWADTHIETIKRNRKKHAGKLPVKA
jgi:DNA-binding HxlR family transcriptional regulator